MVVNYLSKKIIDKNTLKLMKRTRCDESKRLRDNFLANKQNKIIQNLVMSKPCSLFENHDLHRVKPDTKMPHQVKPDIKITDQKRSGRCWLYGCLHPIAVLTRKLYDLDKDFFFSTSYLYFWHKQESTIKILREFAELTSNEKLDYYKHNYLVHRNPFEGGYNNHAFNLIKKYGLIPANHYNDVKHNENSRDLIDALKLKVQDAKLKIYKLRSLVAKNNYIKQVTQEIYNILCFYLGTPPEKISFRFKDPYTKREKNINVTPLEFYNEYVPFDVNEQIFLINDPRKPYNQLYKQHPYKNNIYGQPGTIFLNKSSNDLLNYIKKSINNNFSVPLSCDVSKEYHRSGLLHTDNYQQRNQILNIKPMNKLDKLEFGYGYTNHTMAIVGYDSDRKLLKIANSWGDKHGFDGHLIMTEDWFHQHCYKIGMFNFLLTRSDAKIYQTGKITQVHLYDILF